MEIPMFDFGKQEWMHIGTSGEKEYYIQKLANGTIERHKIYNIDNVRKLANIPYVLSAFRDVCSQQLDGLNRVFDHLGDQHDPSFLIPRLNMEEVWVVQAIERRKKVKGEPTSLRKNACFRPKGASLDVPRIPTLFVTPEGLNNLRVLWEDLAHAFKRKVKYEHGPKRYLCHFDIFTALKMSRLWAELPDAERNDTEKKLTEKQNQTALTLVQRCSFRSGFRNHCGCDGI